MPESNIRLEDIRLTEETTVKNYVYLNVDALEREALVKATNNPFDADGNYDETIFNFWSQRLSEEIDRINGTKENNFYEALTNIASSENLEVPWPFPCNKISESYEVNTDFEMEGFSSSFQSTSAKGCCPAATDIPLFIYTTQSRSYTLTVEGVNVMPAIKTKTETIAGQSYQLKHISFDSKNWANKNATLTITTPKNANSLSTLIIRFKITEGKTSNSENNRTMAKV